MEEDTFMALAETHNIRGNTYDACFLVKVRNHSINKAARIIGIAPSTVSRALKKMRRPICDKCGNPIA